jgi:predicted metal-dependent enzyme (double-stranded beta helix superfamily)
VGIVKRNQASVVYRSSGTAAALPEKRLIRSSAELGAQGRRVVRTLTAAITEIVNATTDDERRLCIRVGKVLANVLTDISWISESLRQPVPRSYRRELLYEAPSAAFSIGCFVWAPGQQTPIHDHNGWSVVGCALGALESVPFRATSAGTFEAGQPEIVRAGHCLWSQAEQDDIHRLGAFGLATAVSVHVYGSAFANASRRKYLMDGTVLPR